MLFVVVAHCPCATPRFVFLPFGLATCPAGARRQTTPSWQETVLKGCCSLFLFPSGHQTSSSGRAFIICSCCSVAVVVATTRASWQFFARFGSCQAIRADSSAKHATVCCYHPMPFQPHSFPPSGGASARSHD